MKTKILIAAVVLWGLALVLHIPASIPGWFYRQQPQSISLLWMGIWGLFVSVIVANISRIPTQKHPMVVFFLVLLSPFLLSLAGEQPLLDHCTSSGHAEFVITGSRGFSATTILHDYESFVLAKENTYAASKPPGQVLFYMMLNSVLPATNELAPDGFVDAAHHQLSLFLLFLLPLLAALTVFPLFSICHRVGIDKPWLPVLLFVLSPPYALVVMHLDQALYPLLACCVALCTQYSYQEKKMSYAVVGGCIFALATFISFSLLPVLLLLLLLLGKEKHSLQVLLYGLLGFVGCYLCFSLLGGYNPIVRYQHAMIHHAQWKGFPWTWGNWWIATKVNIAEFLLWMGPVVVLFPFSLYKRSKEACVFLILFAGLLFFGKAAGEVIRLWIFLMPFLWMQTSQQSFPHPRVLVVLMALWTCLMKWQMDF